ncbi:MAG: FGGY family carbohydrate kinase [Acidimicrobiales bacterium]
MSVLVVDIGTSGVRAAAVGADGTIAHSSYRQVLPTSPMQGFVEFDPAKLASAAVEVASSVLSASGTVDAMGIANQRASTILWDRATGSPVGPGIGWQDLRTVGMCLMLRSDGIFLAPNASASKLVALLEMADQDRQRDLCFGTVDSYVAFVLSKGALHVTDHTNAAVTGLVDPSATSWDLELCDALRIPRSVLPRIVASSGPIGRATLLDGAPELAGIAGDQQASLVGQGCLSAGEAKATFGTGAMLDCCVGTTRPDFERRGAAGTFPIVAFSDSTGLTWGLEAVMLSAGTCVEWLRDDLGLIQSAAEVETLACSVPDSGGVYFVPALLGLGTPVWDFGARGTMLGISRGTTAAHVARAALEGIAHRGADLLEAAVADSGLEITTLRVDGGMSGNDLFLQMLADASGARIEVSAISEATTLGAAFLAGASSGLWPSLGAAAEHRQVRRTLVPRHRVDRDRWAEARSRAEKWVPELSSLEF